MNLFKNELFNPTLLSGLPPRSLPSYREPPFAPRYGRRRPVSPVVPDEAVPAIEAHALGRIGDEFVRLDLDQAA